MNDYENPIPFNNEAIRHLRKARVWAIVMSISGLIILAALLAGYLLMLLSPVLPDAQLGYVLLPAILFLAVWFFPVWYLFRFAQQAKLAITTHSQTALSSAMRNLSLHYRCMGILMLLVVLYAILPFVSGMLFSPTVQPPLGIPGR